jgi:N-methylhydantoinase A/oxoprolinase/acetone carboxylase beta subunit
MLTTDVVHDESRTMISDTSATDPEEIADHFEEMESALTKKLISDGIAADDVTMVRSIDLRYRGQFHILNIEIDRARLPEGALGLCVGAFHAEHQRLYGHHDLDEPTEIVALRARAIGTVPRIQTNNERKEPPGFQPYRRPVYFGVEAVSTTIVDRKSLRPGEILKGPAVIEEATSTTLVPPGFAVTADRTGCLFLRLSDET